MVQNKIQNKDTVFKKELPAQFFFTTKFSPISNLQIKSTIMGKSIIHIEALGEIR